MDDTEDEEEEQEKENEAADKSMSDDEAPVDVAPSKNINKVADDSGLNKTKVPLDVGKAAGESSIEMA